MVEARHDEFMNTKVLWLRERFGWMGKHSGYDQVCEAIAKQHPGYYQSVWRQPNKSLSQPKRYLLSRLMRGNKHNPFYNIFSTAAEAQVLWKSFFKRQDLVHVTYVENNLGILPKWKHRLSFKLVGTVHQPASWWRMMHRYPKSIAGLDALIVCASKEIAYFEQYLPGRVFFIPHGIDIEFFSPRQETFKPSDRPRCIFSGKWLRDTQTLAQVIDKVLAQNPGIAFDAIVPTENRQDSSFFRIGRHEQVSWHSGLSDLQLREIYQQASMLVLPLIDCTANNALLEAVACGLPVISNQVGGLPDYTRDTFADLLPVGDVEGMAQAILKLVDDSQEREKRSQAARLFAEENLSWDKVAAQTLAVYQKVIDN
jgi:glycosyltransferase involved in cell wall biosynthesis